MMINDETIYVINTGSMSLNDIKSTVVYNSSITTDTLNTKKGLWKNVQTLMNTITDTFILSWSF